MDGSVVVGAGVEVGLETVDSLGPGLASGSVVTGSEGAAGWAQLGLELSALGTSPDGQADFWVGVVGADRSPLLSKISTV